MLRVIYSMLRADHCYVAPQADYEKLLVQRNRARWLPMIAQARLRPPTLRPCPERGCHSEPNREVPGHKSGRPRLQSVTNPLSRCWHASRVRTTAPTTSQPTSEISEQAVVNPNEAPQIRHEQHPTLFLVAADPIPLCGQSGIIKALQCNDPAFGDLATTQSASLRRLRCVQPTLGWPMVCQRPDGRPEPLVLGFRSSTVYLVGTLWLVAIRSFKRGAAERLFHRNGARGTNPERVRRLRGILDALNGPQPLRALSAPILPAASPA